MSTVKGPLIKLILTVAHKRQGTAALAIQLDLSRHVRSGFQGFRV